MTTTAARAILGVSPTASADAIKAAWRAQAKQHHPDRNPADGGERFRLISEAYRMLAGDRGWNELERELADVLRRISELTDQHKALFREMWRRYPAEMRARAREEQRAHNRQERERRKAERAAKGSS